MRNKGKERRHNINLATQEVITTRCEDYSFRKSKENHLTINFLLLIIVDLAHGTFNTSSLPGFTQVDVKQDFVSQQGSFGLKA